MTKDWWKKKWGKNHICGITRTRLRPGKNSNGVPYVIKLPCKHVFYWKALEQWINTCSTNPPTCPCCRTKIII